MKANSLYLKMARKSSPLRMRNLLLVVPLLLVAYAVVGNSSVATARVRSIGGSVSIDADAGSVDPGGVINYTITVQNGSDAGLVNVTNNLPAHTTLLDAPGCSAENNGGSVSCVLPMFPFDVATIYVSVTVDNDVNCHNTLRDQVHVQSWPSATADVGVNCAP